MGAIASQITSLTIVYSIVYSDADQRKHQSSASLAFVRVIHRGPVNFPHEWPVTRKMFPFDDVIMKWELSPAWGSRTLTSIFKTYLLLHTGISNENDGYNTMRLPGWPRSGLYLDGLVQERPNSFANALEVRLSCTNPSISSWSATWRISIISDAYKGIPLWA